MCAVAHLSTDFEDDPCLSFESLGITDVICHYDTNSYAIATGLYGAVGLAHIARGQQYWRELGLVVVPGSIIASCIYGHVTMIDVFLAGGFLSLVLSMFEAWAVGPCRRRQPRPVARADVKTGVFLGYH